ncbi:MAG: hypothetical protein MSC30_12715 [Gaiellaceae bacterium MAG52_C11]|nr:hypothetical protein [Candidatus Gaiellasilicea maunaloa]
MTGAVDERAFQRAYRDALGAVTDNPQLAFRLPGSSDLLTLRGYLAACETLYVEVLALLRGQGEEAWPVRVHDAGGSFGVFGAALRSLAVGVVDDADGEASVDLVVGLALHGQPSAEEIASHGRRLSRPRGRLVLVVPSSRYWRVRLAELRGRRPPSDDGSLELGSPAYDRRQLEALLRRNGLRPELVRALDYSPAALGGPLLQTVSSVAMRVVPRHREVWLALATRDST